MRSRPWANGGKCSVGFETVDEGFGVSGGYCFAAKANRFAECSNGGRGLRGIRLVWVGHGCLPTATYRLTIRPADSGPKLTTNWF